MISLPLLFLAVLVLICGGPLLSAAILGGLGIAALIVEVWLS
ncbi:hypothetical protein [Streptomyces sp. NPDC003952]